MYNSLEKYVLKNGEENLFIYTLKPETNALKLERPTHHHMGYLLNEYSLEFCDELQYLNYNDSTER